MKGHTKTQEMEYERAVIKGGVKGLLGGLAFALPTMYYLNRRSAFVKTLPPSIKALGVTIVATPAFVICAERAGLKYDESHWIHNERLAAARARETERWKSMSTLDKLSDFALRHQFSIIAGGWVASILGAYAWFSRDKLATPLQKITQTRVWAQGLTIGLLLSTAALTHARASKWRPDNSWQDAIEKSAEADEKKAGMNA